MFDRWRRGAKHGGGDSEVTKAPPGDCEARLAEVAHVTALLDAAEAFRRQTSDAIATLEAAPGPLLRQLQQHSPGGASGGELAAELRGCVAPCVEQLERGRHSLVALQEACQRRRADASAVHELAAAREERWATKLRCDANADELRRRFGPSFSLEEKRARLRAQHEAEEAFERSTEAVAQAVDDLLAAMRTSTVTMVAQVRECYGALRGDVCQPAPEVAAAAPAPPTGASSAASASGPTSPLAVASPSPPVVAAPPPADDGAPLEHSGTGALEHSGTGAWSCSVGASTLAEVETGDVLGQLPSELAGSLGLPKLLGRLGEGPAGCDEDKPGPDQPLYVKGEHVQVWSSAEQAWLEGVVEEVFATAATDGGFSVPAGVIKVSHRAGRKYIRSEAVAASLRKRR